MLDRLNRALAIIVAAVLGALIVVVTFQVLGRYVPFIPRPLWTEEIARLLLAWMVFLGAAVVLRRSDHFVIDMIPERVEERFGRALQVFVLLALAGISLVMLVGGVLMTQGGLTRISTASGLHMAWAFAALPLGGLFMLIFSIELAVKVLRHGSLPEEDTATFGGPPGAPDVAEPPSASDRPTGPGDPGGTDRAARPIDPPGREGER